MEVFDLVLLITFGVGVLLLVVCEIACAIYDHKFRDMHWELVVNGESFPHVTDLNIDEKRKIVSFYDWEKWDHVMISFVDIRYGRLLPAGNSDDSEA